VPGLLGRAQGLRLRPDEPLAHVPVTWLRFLRFAPID
jgi:hypothetical protein